ncbi:hypothetical protein [Thioalkalivibrio thiocyanodenitrificans]|uniref:hypothetical protein n=1 Tax=Thioalkalivibrio thiocyanodenitrificans TaxID=243063 RepID=UPI000477768F|nr:hypothetical protein [Thioalkalivibrio thiocyanodenitrificans]
MKIEYLKFSNGKVWRETHDHQIQGTVYVDYVSGVSPVTVSMAATGLNRALYGLDYRILGHGLVKFSFNADALKEGELKALETLSLGDPALADALGDQYHLNDAELQHAIDAERAYGEAKPDPAGEFDVLIARNGREIRCPGYPQECDYVRVVIDDWELAYWHHQEWGEAPKEVMGALLGALGGN